MKKRMITDRVPYIIVTKDNGENFTYLVSMESRETEWLVNNFKNWGTRALEENLEIYEFIGDDASKVASVVRTILQYRNSIESIKKQYENVKQKSMSFHR